MVSPLRGDFKSSATMQSECLVCNSTRGRRARSLNNRLISSINRFSKTLFYLLVLAIRSVFVAGLCAVDSGLRFAMPPRDTVTVFRERAKLLAVVLVALAVVIIPFWTLWFAQ